MNTGTIRATSRKKLEVKNPVLLSLLVNTTTSLINVMSSIHKNLFNDNINMEKVAIFFVTLSLYEGVPVTLTTSML